MNPYENQPSRAFWRASVAEPDPLEMGDLWRPKFTVGPDAPILTAGSCFASRIGRILLEQGMNWFDAELPPPGLTVAEQRERQYGVFSFRTGNVYTAAALHQWLNWAVTGSSPTESWVAGARHFDPFRASIEPAGFDSADAMLAARDSTLAAMRAAIDDAACFVITLGLTEAWRERDTGAVYQMCPGVRHGVFDPGQHEFHNYTFAEIHEQLTAVTALLHEVNPGLRIILTVSPVPLTATATGNHVLVATTYSKSVLRAVAGQLAHDDERVDYFPAYELVTGSPFKARFFGPNLRTVTAEGVQFVMGHFLEAFTDRGERLPRATSGGDRDDDYCDDAVLDYYSPA